MNASVILAIMAIPTISSISEDALYAVPREFKEASYALGATKFETIIQVIIPVSYVRYFHSGNAGNGESHRRNDGCFDGGRWCGRYSREYF
ncbi:MAG: ABC transporter permease subunit [Desulfosudis oleivorans]|nr:ABC transporter permease subunit [Desulfosudis oleivorans]